jgi:transcriptional regulator with XRE-family HTH domain
MKTIGERIKELRTDLQMSQAQVAKIAGVTQEAISKLERTKGHMPMSNTLQALAKLFDVDPDWILTGKGSRKPVTSLSEGEAELLLLYRSLSAVGQQYVLGRTKQVHADEHQRVEARPQENPQDDPPHRRAGKRH